MVFQYSVLSHYHILGCIQSSQGGVTTRPANMGASQYFAVVAPNLGCSQRTRRPGCGSTTPGQIKIRRQCSASRRDGESHCNAFRFDILSLIISYRFVYFIPFNQMIPSAYTEVPADWHVYCYCKCFVCLIHQTLLMQQCV